MFARENLPKIGYDSRVEVMTSLIAGLIGRKMSASDPKSKIDLLDDEKTVRDKINKADCVAGDVNNGLLPFIKYIIMTLKQDNKTKFIIKRDKKYGGNLVYSNYEELEKDFKNNKIHPLDLKNALSDEINDLLSIFRKNNSKIEKIEKLAYS